MATYDQCHGIADYDAYRRCGLADGHDGAHNVDPDNAAIAASVAPTMAHPLDSIIAQSLADDATPVHRFTYRDMILTYSKSVASGTFDTDLTPRQRRIVHVLLNTASGEGWTGVQYPPSDQTREEVCKALGAIVWKARALVAAYASARYEAEDFEVAHERTVAILRGV